jgi:hypothetical protein
MLVGQIYIRIIPTSFNSDPSAVLSLVTAICTGFKCLDISMGRIYISSDVVFDEQIFHFAELHPTAGSHYTYDILLVPKSSLCGSITDFPVVDLHPATNNSCSVLASTQDLP